MSGIKLSGYFCRCNKQALLMDEACKVLQLVWGLVKGNLGRGGSFLHSVCCPQRMPEAARMPWDAHACGSWYIYKISASQCGFKVLDDRNNQPFKRCWSIVDILWKVVFFPLLECCYTARLETRQLQPVNVYSASYFFHLRVYTFLFCCCTLDPSLY